MSDAGRWRGKLKAILRGLAAAIPIVGPAIAECMKHAEEAKLEAKIDALVRRVGRGDARRTQILGELPEADLERAVAEGVSRLSGADRARLTSVFERIGPGAGGAQANEAMDGALSALVEAPSVRHTLLSYACQRAGEGRLLAPGDRIDGRYEVVELIGVGGMGAAYRARDLDLDEDVVVKFLRAELAGDAACARRFVQEAKVGLSLTHEGIVRIRDVRKSGDASYLTMEWVGGPTLRAFLGGGRKLSWEEAEPIAKGVFSALAYAHAKGVLHLDLKPENVLLPRPDAPKLCDFGLARVVARPGGASLLPGAGTPNYMAPEQQRGGDIDARADVYAAGVLLYEMLAGEVPMGVFEPLDGSLPAAVREAVQAALSQKREKRPRDAGTLLALLCAARTDEPNRTQGDCARRTAPEDRNEPTFGQVVVRHRYATAGQVNECIQVQKAEPEAGRDPRHLGQIMVERGYLTQEQVQEVIRLRAQQMSVPALQITGYEIQAKLGQGSMGGVYKARQVSLDRVVALKLLPARLAQNHDYIERFYREARAAGRLNHENIVRAYDVGEAHGMHFFSMEYIEGENCHQIIRRQKRMNEARVLDISLQIARALEYAHQHDLVHRDVNPENIMITVDGVAKLCDLGLARDTSRDSSLTEVGACVGTPHYIAPEQARGEHNIDIRADIYALGASMFHMLIGEPVFDGSSPAVVMTKHLTQPVPPPNTIRPEVSAATTNIILTSMAKDRERRYRTPTQLILAIEAAIAGSVVKEPAQPPPRKVEQTPRSHPTEGPLAPSLAVPGPVSLPTENSRDPLIEGRVVVRQPINSLQVEALPPRPSREQILGMTLATITAPLSSFAADLQALVDKKKSDAVGVVGQSSPKAKRQPVSADPVLSILFTKAEDADPDMQVAALDAIGKRKGRSVVELCCRKLEHLDPRVRRAAASALYEINDASSSTALRQALRNPENDIADPDVLSYVFFALQKIGDTNSIPEMIEFLRRSRIAPRGWWVEHRYKNLASLGKGDSRVRAFLMERSAHPDPDLRRIAVSLLGDF